MKRNLLAAFAAFAIVLTACAPLPVGSGTPAFAQGLVAFDACEDYLAHVKAEAKRIVTAYGLNNGYYGPVWFGGDVALEEFSAADGATVPTAGGGLRDAVAGVDYSTTNVQELGIDEPDIVKTDGSYLYVLSNSRLFVVDVTGEPEITDSVMLENGWGEILLSGDRVIVLSTQYGGG
ncbi:MAG: beta-propeller domain-containing protein, partial [Acidimicrobiia bacterium]